MPVDYGGSVVKPFLGRIVLKKIDGSGPMAVGTQVVIPHAAAMPRNPQNISYITGVNSAGYVSGDVQGKQTPSCTITTVMKTESFFTANFINSLILATNSKGDSDTWGILLDDIYEQDIYDGSKCAGIQVRQFAQGGPIALSMAFLSMYGDSQNDGTIFAQTTFTSTATDPGSITDITKVTYGSSPTADLVNSLAIDLVRPQAYSFYDDDTLFAAGIASGILTGQAVIAQSVKYAATWATGGTVNFGITSAGVSLALLVKNDEDVKDMNAGPRMKVRQFSLYDSVSGGAPLVASAM